MLAEEGFDSLLDTVGLRRLAPLHRRSHDQDAEDRGVRIRRTLERLGPAFIKAGQMLSTRPDLLPDDVLVELRRLQDDVRQISFEEVDGVIASELGAPAEAVFAAFDRIPLAAASIAQVHAATLEDGTAVVVKVQRPGVRDQVETDLDILASQVRTASEHWEPARRYDLPAVVEEFSRAVREELDYSAEARNADRFRRAFEADPTVAFPAVQWEYSSARVLTLERCSGIPLNRPDLVSGSGLDPAAIARAGIYCYLRQIFELGFFHADPHPGNLLAMPDGRVAFTDFGRVGTIGERARERVADLFVAVVEHDAQLATDVLLDLSTRPAGLDPASLEREVERLIGKYYDMTLEQVRIAELVREILGLVRSHHLSVSPEFSILLSTLGILEGVGTQLDPSFNFVSETRPFAERVVRRRYAPSSLRKQLTLASRRFVRSLGRLPGTLDRALRRAGEGEFRLAVRLDGQEPLLQRLEELVDRLAFALMVSAFVVGLSLLLARTPMPPWFATLARVALAAAVGVSAWFFVSLLLARHRSRRGGT